MHKNQSTIMKKIFMFLAAMLCVTAINAQSVSDEMNKINELCGKLEKALEKAPKDCGVAEIDGYVNGCKASALGAVASAGQLREMYSRQIGETVDGVTDVTVTKPSLDDWMALAATLATQAAGMAEVGDSAAKAAQAVKDAPKMKAIGMAKSVKWSGDILPVTGEALGEETKAVKAIIDTLKSGNNL